MFVFSSILQNKSDSLCAAVKHVACQMCASVSKWIVMCITYLRCCHPCLLLNQPLCCSVAGATTLKKYSHLFPCLTFDLYIRAIFSFQSACRLYLTYICVLVLIPPFILLFCASCMFFVHPVLIIRFTCTIVFHFYSDMTMVQ